MAKNVALVEHFQCENKTDVQIFKCMIRSFRCRDFGLIKVTTFRIQDSEKQ